MVLEFKINKKADEVIEYLSNMQKFVIVHPLIFRIDHIENNTYLVHEKLKLGFIPFSFSYTATVEANISDMIVFIRATVFKLTKIEMKFVLTTQSNSTVVTEFIKFSSPLPVIPIMKRVFKKQHNLLFKNINDQKTEKSLKNESRESEIRQY